MASGNRLPLKLELRQSDNERLDDRLDPSLVMAEKDTRDVVDQAQSVGDLSPSDVPATKQFEISSRGDEGGVSRKAASSGIQSNDNAGIFSDAQTNGDPYYHGNGNAGAVSPGATNLSNLTDRLISRREITKSRTSPTKTPTCVMQNDIPLMGKMA